MDSAGAKTMRGFCCCLGGALKVMGGEVSEMKIMGCGIMLFHFMTAISMLITCVTDMMMSVAETLLDILFTWWFYHLWSRSIMEVKMH